MESVNNYCNVSTDYWEAWWSGNKRKSDDTTKKKFENKYWIEPCDHRTAMEIVVKNHYMHRTCPCSRAFCLTDGKEIVGIVTFGVPCSSTLLKGVCGEEEMHNVYELNRLWVRDDVPKNGESFLVANSIKQLDKEIIVSFSDTSVGHVGYIYQATNFLYCGLSAKFKDIRVKGKERQHHSTFGHGMTNKQISDSFGKDNIYFVDRPRKHRYVFFNASKKRRAELMKKLKYKVLPYPKGDTTKHDTKEKYGY